MESLKLETETVPISKKVPYEPDAIGFMSLTVIFLAASIVLVFVGWREMYADPKLVGGDAYNFIIGSIRGAGIIGAGIASAVIGAGTALLGLLTYLKPLLRWLKEKQ